MEYTETKPNEVPMSLLLEADPSEQNIRSYLDDAWCFVAKMDGKVVGVCVAKMIFGGVAEILNVSVSPEHQKKGIGTGILRFSLAELASKKVDRVELGTGTFGYQLTYYHRVGFRVDRVVKDHFLLNYPEPIIENGIQHQDMLKLYMELDQAV